MSVAVLGAFAGNEVRAHGSSACGVTGQHSFCYSRSVERVLEYAETPPWEKDN